VFPKLKYIVLASAFLLFFSCKKDAIITDSSAKLHFTTDTVMFDTVFTTIGSTTHNFRVHNRNKKAIVISSIELAGGVNSPFRINVDGVSGTSFSNIEIPAKDSIYIFVEVTIDQTAGVLPFIINDSIIFITNSNIQDVKLVAWGQDAHFFNGKVLCDMTWTNDKPYVIYNSILVDSNCTLTINQGVQVYTHSNAGLFVDGTLIVNGTVDDPVVFQGDRLESYYDDIPGQWYGIFILRGSTGSVIDHALIKNAFYGVSAGSFSNPDLNQFTLANAPDVLIKRTVIQNMSYTGIFGFKSNITAENTLIYNCVKHGSQLAFGGTYAFTHVTMVNNGLTGIDHGEATLALGNFAEDESVHYKEDLNATFTNCIISGSLDEELEYSDDNIAQFNYLFENCLLKTEMNVSAAEYIAIIKNQDPIFQDELEDDYHLQLGSPCRNAGKLTFVLDDLDDVARSDGAPDIGAYEYVP